jgi:hypothetical protein
MICIIRLINRTRIERFRQMDADEKMEHRLNGFDGWRRMRKWNRDWMDGQGFIGTRIARI